MTFFNLIKLINFLQKYSYFSPPDDGFYRKFLRGGKMAPPVAMDILKKYFELRQANPNYFQVCANQSVTECSFLLLLFKRRKVLHFKLKVKVGINLLLNVLSLLPLCKLRKGANSLLA
jgi:hypothetical protein